MAHEDELRLAGRALEALCQGLCGLGQRWPIGLQATVVEAGELRVCCASALGVAVFVSADLVINPSQTMRIETSA